MADKEELKGGISMDTTNAVASITELNRSIKILDTGFKAAASGIQDWTVSETGNEQRITSLNGIIDLQKQKVANLTAEYEKAKASTGANSTAAQNLAIAVNKAQGALNKSQLELQQTTTKLKSLETEQKKQPSLWSQMATSAQKNGNQTSGVVSTLKSHFAGLAGIVTGAFAGFTIKGLVTEASEAEDNLAQLGAVLKSTGQKAGVTKADAEDLATALSKVTKYSDDDVISVENLLLTFTKIGKNVFPQATEAALNMSTALGQDAKSSAQQLGKALNDPATGYTKLQKVGVVFTASQISSIKAMEKAGDVAGAQKVILNELASEYGNSARAAGETYAGKLQIAENAMKETKETIGGSLLPAFTEATPVIQDMAQQIAAAFTAHKDDITNAITGITTAIKNMFDWIVQHGPEVKGIIIGIASALLVFKIIPGIINTVTKATAAFGTITGIVQAIISPTAVTILLFSAALAGLAIIIYTVKQNWSVFAEAVSAGAKVIGSAANTVKSVFGSMVADIVLGIAQLIQGLSGSLGAFQSFFGFLGNLPVVGGMFSSWSTALGSAQNQISGFYKSALANAASAEKGIKDSAAATGDAWNNVLADDNKAAQAGIKTITDIFNKAKNLVSPSESGGLGQTAEAEAKKTQDAMNKLLNQANGANTAGKNTGDGYAAGLGGGLASGVKTAKLSAAEISASLGKVNTKPFEDKIKAAIKQSGTDLSAAAAAVTNLVTSEQKSVESVRDAAVNKLELRLAALDKAETAQLNRTSSKNKTAVENEYTTKKNAIDNEVELRKAQADKEIAAIKSVGQTYSDQIAKELEAQKQFVSGVNSLESEITDALKKRYEAEEKSEETHLNKRLDKLSKWKDESEKEINDYYDNAEARSEAAATAQESAIQRQIDALDKESTAEDRAAKLKEYTDKITGLQKQIAFSHDDYNKSQLQKSLDSTTSDYQKQIADYAKEDKKSALQAQLEQIKTNLDAQKKAMGAEKKTELADIDEIYTKKKTRLENQLKAIKAYYSEAEESANLEAEAEKMIMQNNQNDIIALLQSYSDQYKAAGTTLGDMLVQGFQPAIANIKSMIASITASIKSAKEAALEAKESSLRSESKSVNNSRSYSLTQNIGSTRSSASENARYAENVLRRAARGVG